uniref:Putative secreted salivary protein n=1 Tax=Ixodes scapularis TaxID=6945 RepID=Q4PN50_IXOSC|nr:putative secreted salivary protein [Ixodes scapularis]
MCVARGCPRFGARVLACAAAALTASATDRDDGGSNRRCWVRRARGVAPALAS